MFSTPCHVHIIGAGLAGLSAAVELAGKPGLQISLYEATAHAGGLCRSFYCSRLDRLIDNGNHLILSGNRAVLRYAEKIGSTDHLDLIPPVFPFFDLASKQSWKLHIPTIPIGAFAQSSRPPDTSILDLLDIPRLLLAGRQKTVADAIRGRGAFWRSFWEPLTIAVLNAPPEQASARLMGTTLKHTFLRGPGACCPVLARDGLGPALIAPALTYLEKRDTRLQFRQSLVELTRQDNTISGLVFSDGSKVTLGTRDKVILAVPPKTQGTLLPEIPCPSAGLSILNAHYRVDPAQAQHLPPLLGVLGGTAQWIFRRKDLISVTVSAAEAFPVNAMDPEKILDLIWREIAEIAGMTEVSPIGSRFIRMRQATFEQSPKEIQKRPATFGPFTNLFIAGAQVGLGLPCTLESAALSGVAAADAVLDCLAKT